MDLCTCTIINTCCLGYQLLLQPRRDQYCPGGGGRGEREQVHTGYQGISEYFTKVCIIYASDHISFANFQPQK